VLRDAQSRTLGSEETEAAQEVLHGVFGLKEIHERTGQQASRKLPGMELPARLPPELAPGEDLLPPLLPALERASVNPELPLELRLARRARTLPEGAHEDDDDTEVDPAAQEPHRGRRRPPPALISCATEAEAPGESPGHRRELTARFARVVGTVKRPPAQEAASLPGSFGKVFVNLLEEGIKS
jgi:hypothetical protein